MPSRLIDTHCHLTFKDLLARRDAVIARAVEAGVNRMITIACSPGDFEPALETCRQHEALRAAGGIHPHDAGRVAEVDLDRLERFWSEPCVVAAGEMGLDYHYDFSPREVQQSIFADQLQRASAGDLPVVIHCREAHEDVVRILIEQGYAGRRVVFHCFSGTPEEAAELRSHGWWTSFTGVITFKKADGPRQACVETPREQLMFETDAPYLSPEPVRKMRPNEPCNLVHTIRFAAAARGETFEELAEASTANALRFFGLEPD